MTIIHKFIIFAALLGALALSPPVESNKAGSVESTAVQPVQAPACCASCLMQGMGSEYCDRCFQTQGGC